MDRARLYPLKSKSESKGEVPCIWETRFCGNCPQSSFVPVGGLSANAMDDYCEGYKCTWDVQARRAKAVSRISTNTSFFKECHFSLPAFHIRVVRMADGAQQPHSDTLAPPRKSVELEDPGAHELCEDTLPSVPYLLFASEKSNFQLQPPEMKKKSFRTPKKILSHRPELIHPFRLPA